MWGRPRTRALRRSGTSSQSVGPPERGRGGSHELHFQQTAETNYYAQDQLPFVPFVPFVYIVHFISPDLVPAQASGRQPSLSHALSSSALRSPLKPLYSLLARAVFLFLSLAMPDLNSVPASPRVLATSRHPSASAVGAAVSTANAPGSTAAAPSSTAATNASSTTAMGTNMPPPPVPTSPSLMHVFPSNQMAVNQSGGTAHSSALPSPYFPPHMALAGTSVIPSQANDGPGVGPGPGPLRHPRPLTAAELHMQLEKEQEAVVCRTERSSKTPPSPLGSIMANPFPPQVNRLTRELTLLRAQNASVVSNASSTSASAASEAAAAAAAPPSEHGLFSGTSGFYIPSSTGRHSRTYSNTSTRSQTAGAAAAVGSTPSVVGITAPAPVRPSAPIMSRQNSTASRRSRANSPAHSHIGEGGGGGGDRGGPYLQHSPHNVRGASASASGAATPSASEASPAILPGTARYEETAFYRAELESVKRENEALRRRIRELERAAAASTVASANTPGPAQPTSHPTSHPSQQPHHPHTHHHHQHPHHQSQNQPQGRREPRRDERRSSDASRGRSESVSTTASSLNVLPAASSSTSLSALVGPSTPASMSAVAVAGSQAGGGSGSASTTTGVSIAGRRESGRERVTSMLSVASSVAGSVAVGVPEDEVRVGESAASAGLRAQEGSGNA